MNPYAFLLFVLVLSIHEDKELASDARRLLELCVPRLRCPMWLARIILAVVMSVTYLVLFELLANPVQMLSIYPRNGAQTYQEVKKLADEAQVLKHALYNMTVLLGRSTKVFDRNLASHLRREVPFLDMLRGRLVQVSEEFRNASYGLLLPPQDSFGGDFFSDLSKLTFGLFALPFLINLVGRFLWLVHVKMLDTSPEHAAVAARIIRPPRFVLLPGKEVPVSEKIEEEETADYLAAISTRITDVHKAVQETRGKSQALIYETCRTGVAEFSALITTSLPFRVLCLLWLVLTSILQARYKELKATKQPIQVIVALGEIAIRKVKQMQRDVEAKQNEVQAQIQLVDYRLGAINATMKKLEAAYRAQSRRLRRDNRIIIEEGEEEEQYDHYGSKIGSVLHRSSLRHRFKGGPLKINDDVWSGQTSPRSAPNSQSCPSRLPSPVFDGNSISPASSRVETTITEETVAVKKETQEQK